MAQRIQSEPPPDAEGSAPAPPVEPLPRHVLLIEDSDDLRSAYAAFLQKRGHQVTEADNGLDGVSRLVELRPDVGLVDVGLPDIDGYEVARRVRAVPGGEALYLVALTGYGGQATKTEAENAGFDLLLTKPVDLRELLRVVQQSRPSR